MPIQTSVPVASAEDVLRADLAHLRAQLADELRTLSGSRLLITGGAGFLGYYLVQAITDWNASAAPADRVHLTVWDNFARGAPDWLRQLEGSAGLRVDRVDLIAPLPSGVEPFDWVIHAAGIASPRVYRMYPLETIDANINGLRNLLEWGRRQAEAGRPLRGFLFYSSSEIYGDPTPDAIPTPESYRGLVSCTGPRACYDESKRFGETLATIYARYHGLPVTIARPFNNYGPGLKITDGRVIPDFAHCLLEGRDIVMHSDGSPTRTFCYAADAVAGYYKVLVRGRPGEPYNVGVETPEVSMRELAERLGVLGRELLGWRGRVVTAPSAEADYLVDNPNRRSPVIAKARVELGYAPGIGLDEGLRRSLLWYAGHRTAAAG
ncbi:MAG TPA: NAD-dependent epimerase/dehydratase family protein [Gemmatimonadales bacterium]|nr:NAD-dependent epimerase/dehydratase family protein [Gemmatimonadales bacterium]